MKRLFAVLLICCSAEAGPFDVMLLVTRQDPSMDWWYAVPEGFPPELSRIDSVNLGEYFRIIPFFRGYKTDIGNAAGIVFDVKVFKPDGTVHLDLPKLEGHIGLADGRNRLPSQAVVNMCFDPDDSVGDYRIEVTSVDKVAARTNVQHRVIRLNEFKVETLSGPECENLFHLYPAGPNPARALSAFLQTEHSFFNEEKEPIWSAIWFFKTVFENNDYLVPLMMKEYGFCKPKQKQDIILVAALLDKTDLLPRLSTDMKRFRRLMEAGRIPDPYDEVTTLKQLDMLWAEFYATGTVKPVRQIISSLALVEHKGSLDKIESGMLDPDSLDGYRLGMLEAVFQSALWSLKSNCREVPLVYHYCIGILNSEELEKPVQSCLAMLLQAVNEDVSGTTEKEEAHETDCEN